MTGQPTLGLRQDVQLDTAALALFTSRVLDDGLHTVRHDSWQTTAEKVELDGAVLHVRAEGRDTGLYELDGVLASVGLFDGQVFAAAAGTDAVRVEAVLTSLREKLPTPDPRAAHEVSVTFWTYSPHGPQPTWRSIAVPGWSDIEENYAAKTRSALAAIMDGFEPAQGGQLVLWHGPAGTGKTFALRALAWEWRNWCEFNYIVDPDSFFGQHSDYLMSVLLQPAYVGPLGPRSFRMGPSGPMLTSEDSQQTDRPWRLLVLEDAGELIEANARAATGQGLSRLLNVVDGLIGQGLRVLVLVTTNEEIRRLHPAVGRPGRCAAKIEFDALASAEAGEWLRRHGVEEARPGTTTLASLFARVEGREAAEAPLSVGFGDV